MGWPYGHCPSGSSCWLKDESVEGAGSTPARCWAAAPRGAVIILVPVQVSPPQRRFRQGRNIGSSVPRFFFLLLGQGRGENRGQGYWQIKDSSGGMLPPSLKSREPVRYPLGTSFKLKWGVMAMCSRAQQERCSRTSVIKPSPPMSPVGEEGPLPPYMQVMSYETLLFGKH